MTNIAASMLSPRRSTSMRMTTIRCFSVGLGQMHRLKFRQHKHTSRFMKKHKLRCKSSKKRPSKRRGSSNQLRLLVALELHRHL